MKKTFQTIKLITLAVLLSLGLSFAYAWTVPTTTPPGGNTNPPLNTSTTAQVKNGGLSVNAFTAFGSAFFAGNVGIGTAAPAQKLDVNGGAIINGVLSAGKVQLVDVVTTGAVCSPNGLIARDATGLILSCQSGLWTAVTGVAGPAGPAGAGVFCPMGAPYGYSFYFTAVVDLSGKGATIYVTCDGVNLVSIVAVGIGYAP